MTPQNYEIKTNEIRERFLALKRDHPDRLEARLNLSWSNWGFGREPLKNSAARLARSDVSLIELHGNHYGTDLGYRADETRAVLEDFGISVAGICGMFSADNDLSSNRSVHRQAAIDYLRREIEFTAAMGGSYLLVVPGAVGRPTKYDDAEFERSVETLRLVGDEFVQVGVRGAIEPIRAAEVSFCHTIREAQAFIQAVDHPGICSINADVYHMQSGESHVGMALLDAGEQLVNLHMADSNRCALGEGSLDLDTIIRALYLIGYNRPGCYVTPEPLGPGGDPYPAMHGVPDPRRLDALVEGSVTCFRAREAAVLGG